ncbi:MAG: sugar ABC transporter permease [Clostridiales bacterium]|nr:sugar ABC transporter permease [Clostridiales bacterium]
MKKRRKFLSTIAPYGYVMPISLILLTFVVGSVVISLIFSFTKYNLLLDPEFIQFDNYKRMLTDPKMHLAVINTLKVMVLVVPLQVVLSVLFSVLVASRKHTLIGKIAKAAIFIPVISSNAVVGTVWKTMLNARIPVLSDLLDLFGIDTAMLLGSSTTAIVTVSMIMVWKSFGYYMVLNLATLLSIPDSYYEAAKVDGGGTLQRFRYITLPLMKPAIMSVLMLGFIYTFKAFDLMFTMTSGGPLNATDVLGTYSYNLSFRQYEFSLGSATAMVLFCCLFIIGLFYLRMISKEDE